jgi:hypothetical protein
MMHFGIGRWRASADFCGGGILAPRGATISRRRRNFYLR